MATFPVLSRVPGYPLDPDGELDDAAVRSPFDAGYEQTRPKFTRARRTWGINYRNLPDADVAILRAFELVTLVNGSDSFTWVHPLTGDSYGVRLTAPIKYARTTAPGVADASFTIREV